METAVPTAFMDQQWCRSILQDPRYTRAPLLIHDNNPFFINTMHSETMIRASIYLQNVPDGMLAFQPHEYLALLDVGEDVIGQSGLCHGGFLATIMDEVTGRLLSANGLDQGSSPYTVLLNVTFKSPVYAPGVILVTAEVAKVEGRKMFLTATIQNGERVVCATAEVLYIRKKATL